MTDALGSVMGCYVVKGLDDGRVKLLGVSAEKYEFLEEVG